MHSLMLVDANNVCVRNIMNAAVQDFQAGGVYTGGVYGTLRTLMSLAKAVEIQPSGIVAFFDGGIPKRRMRFIPEFKANRKEKKELLPADEKEKAYAQLDLCWEMMELLGIAVAKYAEREADDCLGAAVQAYRRLTGRTPVVVSGDHDLYQTVNMGAEVWDLGLRKLIDKANFSEHVGIPPEAFLLYRTLIGDSSDGIKGAGGVGESRAVELIQEMAQSYEEQSHGSFSFYDITGLEQLTAVVNHLMNPSVRKKRAKHEDNIIAGLTRLRNVMQGIDLSNSFGPTAAIEAKLTELPPPPNKLKFLGFCKRLKFASVLGSPDMYFKPFAEAYARRLNARNAAQAR